MQKNSVGYIVGFAAAVCVVCSLLVSTMATVLKPKQDLNKRLDKQVKVLAVSGLIEEGVTPPASEVDAFFAERIEIKIIDMATGLADPDSGIDPAKFDPQKAAKDVANSRLVETKPNPSRVARVPNHIPVYLVKDEEGNPDLIVLPVEGMGLWGFLYGFLALDADTRKIRGLTFYSHKETPGLGAEVDNPTWKAKWPGRLAFDDEWNAVIRVIKGPAGTVEESPYEVDGLSGATLTSNGVTNLLQFWLEENGFGPYLAHVRGEGS